MARDATAGVGDSRWTGPVQSTAMARLEGYHFAADEKEDEEVHGCVGDDHAGQVASSYGQPCGQRPGGRGDARAQ